MKLLTAPAGNPKVKKGIKQNFANFILHLAPANLSGYEVCPKRSIGCTMACLNTAGRGGMFKKGENTNNIQKARIRKTIWLFENRQTFLEQLVKDIESAIKSSKKKGLTPVFRLNGTSDLSWEKYSVIRNGTEYQNIFFAFSEVQFYDYTAIVGRKVKDIPNYHLTFSRKESNHTDVLKAIEYGMNVAVVFFKSLPETFLGLPVINADEDDLRFLDPKRVICGLTAKGKAKKDKSGFVA